MQFNATWEVLLALRKIGENMKVGITGHQNRPGVDWAWVKTRITHELSELSSPIEGLSCLAEGADQVFAEAILEQGGRLRAIIPKPDYEKHFTPSGRRNYLALRRHAETQELEAQSSDEASFFHAGCYIADHTNLLLAIWDGKPSRGLGGTADVVNYALSKGVRVIQIDPMRRTVNSLSDRP